MNTLFIIIKEVKQHVRNWKANTMMVLFPIVLIIILGTAFSGIFSRTVSLEGVKVLYTDNAGGELSSGFTSFIGEIGKSTGIAFEKAESVEAGINSIGNTDYSAYILLKDDKGNIDLYKNERYNFEANMIQSMLQTFAQRYGALSAVAKVNPASMAAIMQESDTGTEASGYVEVAAIDGERQPGSMDYYAITMLTLIIMYASLTGFWGIKTEKNLKTINRLLQGPVTKIEVFTGKITGGILVTILQMTIVILFSMFLLKTYWGNDLLTVFLVLVSEAVMAVSIGTGIAYLISNDGTASGILNSVIPIFVLLGGGYVPLSQMGGVLLKISNFSPLKWVNESIFKVIYSGDYSMVAGALIFDFAVAALFLVAAAVLSRKEVA
ncbi:MAG: ABC transporter permease [Clostridiales bacterium]|nr:ABC transporter permease [Clostridiales bacterium]